ncbi:MAG: transglutaminase domain-containing protein [Planctomycetes bacterium]|nr:transglutaminase domain-containing protein [Planctomycetota bacterium]
MNERRQAPPALRRAALLSMCAATVLALVNLPDDELPVPWLLAFTLPGAVLGLWSRLREHPLRRAVLAVAMQATACYGALELVGPMTRPAALACTILPPLAFATARNQDTESSLALFLGFCVMLVGIILDGVHLPLLIAYGVAAMLTMMTTTQLRDHASSGLARGLAPARAPSRLRDLATLSSLLLGGLVAALAVDRTLSCLPSPSRSSGGDGAGDAASMSVGLDDSFVLDSPEGVLAQLNGEQLVRARHHDGRPISPALYLRCGFFAVPGMDRWLIGRLDLAPVSDADIHRLSDPLPGVPLEHLELERYAGASKFVFLPGRTRALEGLHDLSIDPLREWVRPTETFDERYTALYQDVEMPLGELRPSPNARQMELTSVPRALDQAAIEVLLQRWQVDTDPRNAMERIAAGLAQHCRYDRSEPTGPFQHRLENFLFAEQDRHGYCMHFASAAALMLRMRGIPCRVAVGLYGGVADRSDPTARIYGSQHAHAWVEVALADGFAVFDPTPPSLRGRATAPVADDAEASAPEVEFEQPLLEPLLRQLREALSLPWTWAIGLAAALLLAALPRRRASAPALTAAHTHVPRTARRLLERLLRLLARIGHRHQPGRTLEQLADELQRAGHLPAAVQDALVAYQEVRFGGRTFDGEHRARLEAGIVAARALVAEFAADGQPAVT